MSLSKEMQRSMSVQMELHRVQQEMIGIKGRMEVMINYSYSYHYID